jgi:type I restriction enzyme, S subunit
MGQSPDGESYNTNGEGVPLINGPVEFSAMPFGYTIRAKFTTQPTKYCKQGDLILCVRGSTTGRMNIAGFDACIGRGVAAIRAKQYQRWINYFVLANRGEIHDRGTGATFPNVSGAILSDFKLGFPEVSEQQRIVAILDETFDGIATAKANVEKNLQNARAVFESYLQAIFGRRGSGWVEKPLGEICTFSSGGTPTKDNSSYWSGEIPWISGRDMKSTRLSDSHLHISHTAVDEASTRMAPAGTLLILVRGMGLAHGAQIAELMVPCAFNQDIKGIHPEPGLIPRYLLFAIRDRINSSSNVLSNAAHGTLKIDSAELKNLMIPVRSNSDQRRVVATIDSLSEETQRLESLYQQKLAALDELKKSLLHQAFSGEL